MITEHQDLCYVIKEFAIRNKQHVKRHHSIARHVMSLNDGGYVFIFNMINEKSYMMLLLKLLQIDYILYILKYFSCILIMIFLEVFGFKHRLGTNL